MKKLLLLGINRGTYDMMEYAKSIDVYVILVDKFLPNTAPEKMIADKIWAVDTSDLDELEKRARKEKIDGITASSSEFNLDMARELCKRLSLPCFQTDRGWECARDKRKFKKMCLEIGLDAPREFTVSYPPLPGELSEVSYPVIVKPVDAGGMAGLSLCNNAEELIAGCQKALSVSKSGKYLVEEYIEGHELIATYLMDKGDIRLINICECFNSNVMGMHRFNVFRFPARYAKDFVDCVDKKVILLIEKLDCLNGTLFIQAVEKGGRYYFLEFGLRLCSACYYLFLDSITGLNEMRAAVNFALTGIIGEDIKLANPLHKEVGIQYDPWSKGGTVARAKGVAQVRAMKNVRQLFDFYPPGCTVVSDGTLRQMQFFVGFTAENGRDAAEILHKINETLEVYDTEGNDMLIRFEDYDLLLADRP